MFQPTPAAAVLRIYILIIALFYFFVIVCFFWISSLHFPPPQTSVRWQFLFSDCVALLPPCFLLPRGRLCSSLYHIIMPKGPRACGHEHCLGECLGEGFERAFHKWRRRSRRDKVRVCVPACACGGVCALWSERCARSRRGLSGGI